MRVGMKIVKIGVNIDVGGMIGIGGVYLLNDVISTRPLRMTGITMFAAIVVKAGENTGDNGRLAVEQLS